MSSSFAIEQYQSPPFHVINIVSTLNKWHMTWILNGDKFGIDIILKLIAFTYVDSTPFDVSRTKYIMNREDATRKCLRKTFSGMKHRL